MRKQTQNEHQPEHKSLESLGTMPMEEALPIIMEQYQVNEDRALLLWLNNRPPTGFEDSIGIPAEEVDDYMKEVKKRSLGTFRLSFKKRREGENSLED
jgi:hypothetical protein